MSSRFLFDYIHSGDMKYTAATPNGRLVNEPSRIPQEEDGPFSGSAFASLATGKTVNTMTITKRELTIKVANDLGMTQSDVAKVLDEMLSTITRSLAEGERLEFRGFGIFKTKTRVSRMGRNPRTGEQVPVPEKRVVTFRPGRKMKEQVSSPAQAREQHDSKTETDRPS
jgi:nucleoid DNA-binding protein